MGLTRFHHGHHTFFFKWSFESNGLDKLGQLDLIWVVQGQLDSIVAIKKKQVQTTIQIDQVG
jgi:hypothetical protein